MGDVKINDVAGTLFTTEYCDVHIKGLSIKNATAQTGSVRGLLLNRRVTS